MILPQANVPEPAKAFVDRVRRELKNHPLLDRYAQYRLTSSNAPNSVAWHAAGHWYLAQDIVADWQANKLHLPRSTGWSEYEEAGQLLLRLRGARVFLWHDHIWPLMESLPLPDDVDLMTQLTEFPDMFFVCESPRGNPDINSQMEWLLITHEPGSVCMFMEVWHEDGKLEIIAEQESAVGKVSNPLLSRMLHFLTLPYIDQGASSVPRHMRKEVAEHEHTVGARPTHDKQVGVVQIRRKQGGKAKASGSDGSTFELSCQFEVERHRRMQWYPSRQVHEEITIESYIKGPKDKLFRGKVYDVSR